MKEETARQIEDRLSQDEFIREYKKKIEWFREYPSMVSDGTIKGWIKELEKTKSR